MPKIGVGALAALSTKNVVEIKFFRRKPKKHQGPFRRLLGTNDLKLLNSSPGHIALNYKAPIHPPLFNASAKNLLLIWDLLMQEYRLVSCDNCELIAVIPTDPDPAQFWQYFATSLQNMTAQQKTAFMNS